MASILRKLLAVAASFGMSAGALAEITAADYARAERWVLPYDATTNPRVKNLLPEVHWIGEEDRFWYLRETEQGHEFTEVDAATGEKRAAFDHAAVAAALTASGLAGAGANADTAEADATDAGHEPEAGNEPEAGAGMDANRLPFTEFSFEDGRGAIEFAIDERPVRCTLSEPVACAPAEERVREAGLLVSPDERLAVYTEAANLHLLELETGERVALTDDGEPNNGYGLYYGNWKASYIPRLRSGERQVPMETRWSPDSKKVLVTRLDDRHVGVYPFVETAPGDGTHRPKYYLPRIPLVGEKPALLTWSVIDVASRIRVFLDLPYDRLFHLHQDMTALRKVWWSEDGALLRALAWTDNLSGAALFEIDLATGKPRVVIEEQAAPRFDTNSTSYNPPNVEVVGDGAEVIWFSMRDGWGHLYLYDGVTGALKNRITGGDWLVRDIVEVDEERRLIYFTGSGREPGNPYYRYLYRVGFDGRGLRLLSPEHGDHLIASPYNDVLAFDGASGQPVVSPGGAYVAYSYSRPTEPTRSVIRRTADAGLVAEFEAADATALYEAGWRDPVEVVVKAADGTTDLYGLLYKPVDFDPEASYPVIDSQYASPLTAVVPRNFNQVLKPVPGKTPQMSLTELGFVVVVIDARGTAYRSREFSHHSWKNLNLIGLDDHVAAIRQLAAQRPWMDIGRVGVHGSSYGGFTAFRAMFEFPDFFKVGISNVGVASLHNMYPDYHWEAFHGRVLYANETRYYDDPTETPVNYRNNDGLVQAENLKGKLLIMLGELDENVLPATTLQLVHRLIELDKDFDMVYAPNRAHSLKGRHFLRRMWNYFVEHLHGQKPPAYRMRDDERNANE
ncbi:MAG: prolyl oligopeptidase family serine peptidase [Gammaproteobacteria bacterium]|nr:prolyl oligopeptidase family serine peptidase [Gammaproteobacteria bacterium]